jgi:hypothetical protein
MSSYTDRYYICNGCGADSRNEHEHIIRSPGNAFVTLRGLNTVTQDDIIEPDFHLCSTCWGRVQAAWEGRELPARRLEDVFAKAEAIQD